MFPQPIARTIGTSGTVTAITPSEARRAGATPTLTTQAATTLTHMATGTTSPTTVAYGSPLRTLAGRPIARAGGCMNPATTGPGSPTSPGAGHRITTAAGSSMEGTGAGGRDLSMADIIRSGRRRTSLSSALAASACQHGSRGSTPDRSGKHL